MNLIMFKYGKGLGCKLGKKLVKTKCHLIQETNSCTNNKFIMVLPTVQLLKTVPGNNPLFTTDCDMCDTCTTCFVTLFYISVSILLA